MRSEATTPTPDRGLSLDLQPMVDAARRARELVTEACARWQRPELAESAYIAVTELVNNVVVHARTPMTVRLALLDGELHVAVRDYSDQPPRRGEPTQYGGRGLMVLDAVARRWGYRPGRDGKVVWAVLGSDDE